MDEIIINLLIKLLIWSSILSLVWLAGYNRGNNEAEDFWKTRGLELHLIQCPKCEEITK